MTFYWPYALLALPLVLAGLLALFATTRRARIKLLERFASARLLPILLVAYSPALRLLKNCCVAAGVLLVVFALARPQWGYDWQENRSRGVDVVFVIDTSRSMLSQDVQPSQLKRAKLAIYDCVEKMPGNRVGLVAFAGDAFLQCPLTLDYDAFRQSLEAVDTNTIATGGTDIAVGLDAAATALEKSGNHKIIVLLTDGEDLEGQGVAEAKTLADQGVTIYTVGVGTADGEVIPFIDDAGRTNFVRDQRGELVKSHLDATTLSDIANATHGFYQPLGPTGEGLLRVYENGIKKLPTQTQESQMRRQAIERFQWPLAAGTLLLMLELLIGTRRLDWFRRAAPTVNLAEPPPLDTAAPAVAQKSTAEKQAAPILAVLFAFFVLASIPRAQAADTSAPVTTAANSPAPAAPTAPASEISSPKAAEGLFEKGDYSAAASAYDKAAEAAPQDGRLRYNQGESLYRNKDYEGAAQAFTKSLSSSDLSLQEQAYYNLGNAHYRLGADQQKEDPKKTVDTWETAVKDFQNALDLDPNDADAHYNHDLVNKQVEALKKQLEQQQKQSDQSQSKSDQNNSKPDQQNQQNQSQNDQNQQNQDNSSQKNQSSSPQNKSNPQNSSNPQNQSSSDNSKSSDQSSSKNSPNKSNPSDGKNSPSQNQSSPQKSPNGDQKQPQKSPDKSGQQTQPKPAPGQGTDRQAQNQPGQNGKQPQPASPSGTDQGKEPNAQKNGQQTPAASPGSGQPSPGNPGDTTANGTVMVGVMTREEAMQVLNSLKPNERKLPASRLQAPSQNTSSSQDPNYKNW